MHFNFAVALTHAHVSLKIQSPLESQRRATQLQTFAMNLTVLQRMDPSVVRVCIALSLFLSQRRCLSL